MLSGNIIALTESRLKSSDRNEDYMLPGFHIYRFDSSVHTNSERPYYGTVVYSKFELNSVTNLCLCEIETTVCSTIIRDEVVQLVFIYCPPKHATITNFQLFMTSLLSMDLLDITKSYVVMGDTNLDYHSQKGLERLERRMGICQLMHSSTTDYGSCLDHIYTNTPFVISDQARQISCATLESYYSDHKPIIAYLPI